MHNTNGLLGHDGFVGVKTGSDHAAGGCFAFRAIRRIHSKQTTVTASRWACCDRIAAGLELLPPWSTESAKLAIVG